MRTSFSLAQLADPHLKAAEQQLRACVHCGICTATCPTYVLLGDELDGPRGRIQLIQQMLESGAAPGTKVVTHIDRCLSCLACVSACPSGVNYPRLIDEARAHIERSGVRPFPRRVLRSFLGYVLPRRELLRLLLVMARIGALLSPVLPKGLRQMVSKAISLPRPQARLQASAKDVPANAPRIALHAGCVQEVVAPQINVAAKHVLRRHGIDAVRVEGKGCCGALNHHLGQEPSSQSFARALVADIVDQDTAGRFDAVATTASGCGAAIRDYGFQLDSDAKAVDVASRAHDIMQVLDGIELKKGTGHLGVRIAWHAPCSLTHGMKEAAHGPAVLRRLGFDVVEPRGSMCCGSAGVYNMLEPEIAGELQQRKVAELSSLGASYIATGNIGCLAQIAAASAIPVVHPVELVDWATGGRRPSPRLVT